MSSLHAKKSIKNISQLKLHLKNIIQNIKELEVLEKQEQEYTKPTIAAVAIIEQTNKLLNQIENAPVEKLVQKHKKKKKRKRGPRSKRQKMIVATQNKKPTTSATLKQATIKTVEEIQPPLPPLPTTQTLKLHHQLRNYHDAQRFLRTFELLKILHLARGSDGGVQNIEKTQRFAAQFNNLRAIWNNILLENTPQRTQECKIEDQWNEALFGAREKIYYSAAERKMNDLIRIRRIWDSYLTRSSKYGSSIPIGWVLPKKDADDRWSCYRSE